MIDPNDGLLSLREALQRANMLPTSVHFVNLSFGTYKLTINSPLEIRTRTTIQGIRSSHTIIEGNGRTRVLSIFGSSNFFYDDYALRGLTIRGGNAQVGGGIYIDGPRGTSNVASSSRASSDSKSGPYARARCEAA